MIHSCRADLQLEEEWGEGDSLYVNHHVHSGQPCSLPCQPCSLLICQPCSYMPAMFPPYVDHEDGMREEGDLVEHNHNRIGQCPTSAGNLLPLTF